MRYFFLSAYKTGSFLKVGNTGCIFLRSRQSNSLKGAVSLAYS